MKARKTRCCICDLPIMPEKISGWRFGHNAQPVRNGRCCAACNDMYVIPERIRRLYARWEDWPPSEPSSPPLPPPDAAS